MAQNTPTPDLNLQFDATPFAENVQQNDLHNSEKTDDQRQKPEDKPKPTAKALPMGSVTIGKLHGTANVGNVYNTTIVNGKDLCLQNTVIYADSSSGDSADSDQCSGTESEPEVQGKILDSALGLSTSNKELVSENIGRHYHKLARHLKGANFSTAEIDNIVTRNSAIGREEGIYQILERWTEKAPEEATVGNLAAALLKVNRTDLANKLSLDEDEDLQRQFEKQNLNV